MTPDHPTPTVTFTLNGKPFTARVDDGTSLMEVLRGQAGLISPKNGCAPQGSCGCCTVLVDGRALSSCVVPARQVAGKHVLTLEGFDARERHVFAHAFAVTGGLQCGFCIPGIVVAARHLIDATSGPYARADCRGAQQPRLPLHRLREDRRCHPHGGARAPRRDHAGSRL